MVVKGLIIAVLLVIVGSLGSGLFYLLRDDGQSHRTVRALTVRIGLSLVLFLILMLGFATGLISPHPAVPPQ
ncbi:twin transmembrane helix small protein [Thiohalorhabdus methylotrophus]|uniref:Twin transmembrane helix small protein n=1 Tax=Thiohalorhabdus methylotrophus TaxID=3242694 RepID=A0ABV4TQ42_9GAMM